MRARVRARSLYVIAVLFGAWMAIGFQQPGFGLLAQAILWPWLAAIGGVVADGWVSRK